MKAERKLEIWRTIPLLIAVCLVAIPAYAKYGGGSGTRTSTISANSPDKHESRTEKIPETAVGVEYHSEQMTGCVNRSTC